LDREDNLFRMEAPKLGGRINPVAVTNTRFRRLDLELELELELQYAHAGIGMKVGATWTCMPDACQSMRRSRHRLD
jgi:hypothetical protein